MKVTLRQRNRTKSVSLYLDIYFHGKRRYEMLNLSLHKAKENKSLSKIQRQENKYNLALAESIRIKMLSELKSGVYGIEDMSKADASFIDYLNSLKEQRITNSGNYGNWNSAIRHILKFESNHYITFRQVDSVWLRRFKEYLDNDARTPNNLKLSQSTKSSYFSKVKAALKQAVRDGIIQKNPGQFVAGIKNEESEREFLTRSEIELLSEAKCDSLLLKRAFLFSCLTGLRFSDIRKLTWLEIQYSNEFGDYLRFQQKKTKGFETLPIVSQARKILGTAGGDQELVFKDLIYNAWNNSKLKEWVLRAGIHKRITFHNARHSYATLLLTQGTDISTVSKMLGHKQLKTTQIYAKVIDLKKREAADKMELNINL